MRIAILAVLIWFVSASFFLQLEKGWKGIKVFQTSRAEVEKILGKTGKEEDWVVWYETEEARYRFLFSDGPCVAPETLLGGYNVENGIVLQYTVRPKNALKVADLTWDKDQYGRAEDFHMLGRVNYYNRRDGIRMVTIKEESFEKGSPETVETIMFERTAEQNTKFGCKDTK